MLKKTAQKTYLGHVHISHFGEIIDFSDRHYKCEDTSICAILSTSICAFCRACRTISRVIICAFWVCIVNEAPGTSIRTSSSYTNLVCNMFLSFDVVKTSLMFLDFSSLQTSVKLVPYISEHFQLAKN